MKAETLRDMQAPFKALYREVPEKAVITLKAKGQLGISLCSGDMLLEALVACAGVTMKAVATALDLPLKGGTVSAEGDLDFRGTLGVAKDEGVPVGFTAIRLRFDLEHGEDDEAIARLLELTERYCVVFQTLTGGVPVELS